MAWERQTQRIYKKVALLAFGLLAASKPCGSIQGLPSRVACRWRLAPADRRRIETGRAPPDAGAVSGRSRRLRLLKTWSLRQTRSGSAAAVALAANLLFSSQGGYFDVGAALKLPRSAVRWLKSEHREVEYRGVFREGWQTREPFGSQRHPGSAIGEGRVVTRAADRDLHQRIMPQPVEVDGVLAPTHAPSPSHMDVGCGLARGRGASDPSSRSGRGLTVRSKLPKNPCGLMTLYRHR